MLSETDLHEAYGVLRDCVRSYYLQDRWSDVVQMCRNTKQADAYRDWMMHAQNDPATRNADRLVPKVVGGRRITRSVNGVRVVEDRVVVQMPSQSSRATNYENVLRVPDAVHGRGLAPLRPIGVCCACPDSSSVWAMAALDRHGASMPLRQSGWLPQITE